MDRENDSVVKRKIRAVLLTFKIYCDVICCERRPEISLQRCTGNSIMDKERTLE
jgi:hypothetical protein